MGIFTEITVHKGANQLKILLRGDHRGAVFTIILKFLLELGSAFFQSLKIKIPNNCIHLVDLHPGASLPTHVQPAPTNTVQEVFSFKVSFVGLRMVFNNTLNSEEGLEGGQSRPHIEELRS